MGSLNSTAHHQHQTSDTPSKPNEYFKKHNKKFLQSKKLRNLKVNLEKKFSNKSLIVTDQSIVNEVNLSNDKPKKVTSVGIEEEVKAFDNSCLHYLKIDNNTNENLNENTFDSIPLIDRDSSFNTEFFENTPEVNMSSQQQQQQQQISQRPAVPSIPVLSRFGFKPPTLQLTSTSSIPQTQQILKANDQQQNQPSNLNATSPNSIISSIPISNSNNQLKKFSELNIQLNTSDSSSLSSASSSSSASCSSTNNNDNSNNKKLNTSNSLSSSTSPASTASSELINNNQPQIISYLKQPLTAFNQNNSNFINTPIVTSQTNKSNANQKAQLSIPTLLRSKPLAVNNMQSLSYASLSSTSSSSSNKLNDAETDLIIQQKKQVSNKSQLRFLQPKKPNQLTNLNKQEQHSSSSTTKSMKKSPVLKQPSENLINSDIKENRLSHDSNNNNILTNDSTTTKSNSTDLTSNSKKKDSQSIANNNGGSTNSINKRRLFSPYSLNINNSSNSESLSSASLTNGITNTNETSNSNRIDSENQQKSPQKHQPQTTYKLFSHLNGFKASNNSNQNNDSTKTKYFTKMQVKATHLKSKDVSQQNENYLSKHNLMNDTNSNISLKKEDSAYCSSTSSTVSSQDVENSANFSLTFKDSDKTESELSYHLVEEIGETIQKLGIENDNSEHLNKNIVDYSHNEDDYAQSLEIRGKTETDLDAFITNKSNQSSMSSQINLTNSEQVSSNSLKYNTNKLKSSQIEDSLGELNHLMMTSSSSIGSSIPSTHCGDESSILKNSTTLKQRKASTTSFSLNQSTAPSPMFKPPSQLPPVENGEVITLDIETYRFIMQDLQSTKAILYKVANMLREPTNDCVFDCQQQDEFQNAMISNPLISSLYNHQIENQIIEKIDQSTQTEV